MLPVGATSGSILTGATSAITATSITNSLGESFGSVVSLDGLFSVPKVSAYTIAGLVKAGHYVESYFGQEDKNSLSDAERSAVDLSESLISAYQEQSNYQSSLSDNIDSISNSLPDSVEDKSLPEVMLNNTKPLIDSINLLTSAVNYQFGLLNSSFTAFLAYQQQFYDLQLAMASKSVSSGVDIAPLASTLSTGLVS